MKVTFEGADYVFPEDATDDEIFDFLLRNSEQESTSLDVGKAMGKESKQFAGPDQAVAEVEAVQPVPQTPVTPPRAPSMFGLDVPPPQIEAPVAQQEAPAPTQPYSYMGGDMPPLRAGMLDTEAKQDEGYKYMGGDAPPMKRGMLDPEPEATTAKTLVRNSLLKFEGERGDNLTAVETGAKGMTAATKRKLEEKYDRELTDEEAIDYYLTDLDNAMPKALKKMPAEVQAAVLDLAYNLGEGALRYKGINAAAEAGDIQGVLANTLDTAKAEGGASFGLAKRRAMKYNQAAKAAGIPEIDEITVTPDGVVIYRSQGEVIKKHNVGSLSKDRKGKVATRTGTFKVSEWK